MKCCKLVTVTSIVTNTKLKKPLYELQLLIQPCTSTESVQWGFTYKYMPNY